MLRALHRVRWPVSSLVLPFVVLAALMGGLMPSVSADGVSVVLCTGSGPLEIRVDLETGERIADPVAEESTHCPWGGASATAAVAVPVVFPWPVSTLGQRPPADANVLPARHAHRLPPSTGPPASV